MDREQPTLAYDLGSDGLSTGGVAPGPRGKRLQSARDRPQAGGDAAPALWALLGQETIGVMVVETVPSRFYAVNRVEDGTDASIKGPEIAHATGLAGGDEGAPTEFPWVATLPGVTEGDDLGVGCGVPLGKHLVDPRANHAFSGVDDQCRERDTAPGDLLKS